MTIQRAAKSILWAMAIALLGALSLGAPAAKAQEPAKQDSTQVTKLLKEARTQAVRLQLEADKLDSHKNSDLSREWHARQLNVTKDYVNDLGKTLDKLESRKAEASAWQQKAMQEMRPVLQQVAERTTQAISHLNDNPRQLRHPDYHEMLSDKSALSVQLADLLDDHVKYGETKADLAELEAKVGPLS